MDLRLAIRTLGVNALVYTLCTELTRVVKSLAEHFLHRLNKQCIVIKFWSSIYFSPEMYSLVQS